MTTKLRTLIVDDERLARQELRLLLADFEYLEIVGEAESVARALKIIEGKQPEVVFLDIQLSGESGFDLLEKCPADFKVIFVTAYDEYALRAFEVNALDYLMKPVGPERLEQSLNRLLIPDSALVDKSESWRRRLEYDDRVLINHNSRLIFLKICTVTHIAAAADYSEIHTEDGKKLLSEKTLRAWEEQLPSKYFVRIHRSLIVNLEWVERIEKWFNNSYLLYMRNYTKPFQVSRRYGAMLKQRFG